jgi:hypothetical protein
MSFTSLGLSPAFLKILEARGFAIKDPNDLDEAEWLFQRGWSPLLLARRVEFML